MTTCRAVGIHHLPAYLVYPWMWTAHCTAHDWTGFARQWSSTALADLDRHRIVAAGEAAR